MKNFLHNTWKHRAHVVMALPAFLVLLFFAYIPMGGLVMAFKSYDYTKESGAVRGMASTTSSS